MKIIAPLLAILATARANSIRRQYQTPEEFRRQLVTDVGGAGMCNLHCKDDSHCESNDTYNPCTKCGTSQGTQYYQRCFSPEANNGLGGAGQCNLSCNPNKGNSDCQMSGGFNPCTTCGEYVGTQFYHHCFNANAHHEEDCDPDYMPHGEGQCGISCNSNSDCRKGGFNPCPNCGNKAGTIMYRRCFNPDAESPCEPPTPAPTPCVVDWMPKGQGQCGDECKSNGDCRKGGFNPCGNCGKVKGTEMFGRCYNRFADDDCE